MIDHRGHLNVLESPVADQGVNAPHRPRKRALHAAKRVMGGLQPVDADRNGLHAAFIQPAGGFIVDQGGVTGHSPAESQRMGIAHDFIEILPQQRLAAGDIQFNVPHAEIPLHIVENGSVLRRGKLPHPVVLPAATAAVDAAFIAAQRQLQKEIPQRRRGKNAPAIRRKLPHMLFFYFTRVHPSFTL